MISHITRIRLAPILGLGQVCGWGTLYYSFPLIAIEMHQELGWSKSLLFGGATAGLLAAALVAYPVGVAIDRGWGKWVMSLSALLACFIMFWWASTSSVSVFYVVCIVLGALQAALLYEPAFAVLARHVGAASSRAGITHITLWGGFASTVFIPFTTFFIESWGWRIALVALGLVNALVFVMYQWAIQPKEDLEHTDHQGDKQAKIALNRETVRIFIKRPLFWLITTSLALYALVFSAFTYHMYPLLEAKHLSLREVVWAIALIGPAQVLGRFVVSRYAEHLSMRALGSIMMVVFPLAFAALLPASPTWLLVATVFIAYGISNGILTIVRSFVVPEMLTPNAYGALNGVLIIPATLGRALAPLLAASLWAVEQSYQPVLWALILGSIAMALTFWWASFISYRQA
jgi:predicted MFS family arabinose efflux permease